MNPKTFGVQKQRRKELTKVDSQRKIDKLKGKGFTHNTAHADNRCA
jgi:hypothetical protein